ncbi:MAG: alanine:cation symporter family protein [Clostridiales bacterium]|nr:alanine:cation symporter family protein [Clostridiales bacterium]
MFKIINNELVRISDLVWGVPLIAFIFLVGIYLTLRLNLLQVFHLPKALKFVIKNEEDGVGEVSSFGALCTALSATLGTGNIVGVATAVGVLSGGPGALFWMLVAAFFGMASNYAEGFLAIKYRKIDNNNHVLGGPFYYIEYGMGMRWRWLAKIFAFFGAGAALLGIGTFTQVNGIANVVVGFFDPNHKQIVNILGREYSKVLIIASIVLTISVSMVLLGGIQRISNVSQVIVPFMTILYVLICLLLIVINRSKLPEAISEILLGAFGIKPIAGGILASVLVSMRNGVSRGIFTNEAGMGSTPIASAAAKTNDPVRQGLVTMTATFIDTIVICTMTGISIIMMGSWKATKLVNGIEIPLEGVEVTAHAFQSGIPLSELTISFILMVCLVFFAYASIIGWNYYGERCCEYLTSGNKKALKWYRLFYLLAVFIGPYIAVSAVWTIADIFNGLMALPNLIALLALSGVVIAETKKGLNSIK